MDSYISVSRTELKTCIPKLCVDTGYRLQDRPRAMETDGGKES